VSWDEKAIGSAVFDVESDEWSGHWVYVAWRQRGRPLYVGKTSNLRGRVAFHMNRAPWRSEVKRFTFHRFETAADASDGEKRAIMALNPHHNIVRSSYLGPPMDNGVIREDQLAILRRVQDRGRAA
jgi:excinuclease UvrABC nuclease subunit